MKTIEIKLFSYSELSDKAKEKAYDEWYQNTEYHWADDNAASLKKFCEEIGVNLKNYSYGDRGEGVSWSTNWDYEDERFALSGIRLLRYIQNNWSFLYSGKYYSMQSRVKPNPHYTTNDNFYGIHVSRHSKVLFVKEPKLTGYYIDHSLCSPIYDFIKKPSDNINLEDLINDCFHEWVKDCNADVEYTYSEEAFKEGCESNDWTFEEDGTMRND